MFLPVLLMTALGLFAGFLSYFLAAYAYRCLTGFAIKTRRDLTQGSRARALVLGGLISGGVAVKLALNSDDATGPAAVLGLGVAFVLACAYSVSWLGLAVRFGPPLVEAVELSLFLCSMLLAALYVVGALWITLAITGACFFWRHRFSRDFGSTATDRASSTSVASCQQSWQRFNSVFSCIGRCVAHAGNERRRYQRSWAEHVPSAGSHVIAPARAGLEPAT